MSNALQECHIEFFPTSYINSALQIAKWRNQELPDQRYETCCGRHYVLMTKKCSNADGIAVAEAKSSKLSAQGQTPSTKTPESEVPVTMAALPGTREQAASGMHPKAIMYLLLWYFWSGCTLFLNKYVVFFMKGDPIFLGMYFMLFLFSSFALSIHIEIYPLCSLQSDVHDYAAGLRAAVLPSRDVRTS